jgi:V/A-type H+-transporting ATPase subunit I
MIVPMKKATIIFQSGDAEATITTLRKLGVMQVEHQSLPESGDISALHEKVALITSSMDVLNQIPLSERKIRPQNQISGDWMAIASTIIQLGRRQEQLELSSRNLIGQINEWERWGDIDQTQVRSLAQNGVYLKLYHLPVREVGSFPDDVVAKTIFTAGDIANVVAISRRQFECPFKEVIPPEQGLSQLKEHLSEHTRNRETITSEITGSAGYYDNLLDIKRKLEKEIEFQQVLAGMGREGALGYVTGYIPYDKEEQLIAESRNNKWGILIADPSPDDNVPTLLRNPGWVEMIKPVLGLLGLTPGYHEIDISIVFLIFFSIFFGILIGDAGYGLAYIVITLLLSIWLKKKMMMNREMRTTVSLFYLLGFSAVIWGLLTGTFFGQWGLPALVPQLNDPAFVTSLCFFLGALHLSIAHSWRAILKFPSLKVLADAGYICILWTAFFLARTLILGEPFPAFGIWLVVAGVILVILFTNPRRSNILRGIGEGMGTIALSFMNNITDVISYIRLFAVGMATLAVANTTNYLASGFGTGIIAIVVGAVILLSGHSLNLILGLMSVLVHGVRLNVLEFSGHANVTWSGTSFEPLKE